MALLQSGTRIYGNATVDTFLSITGNTAATDSQSGALKISGGMGILGNIFSSSNVYANNIDATGLLTSTEANISGDTVIGGNLTVNGNTVYVNVSTLNVKDPIIELGGNPNNTVLTANDTKDRGQLLHYYTDKAVDAFMGWKNANGEFVFASNASTNNNSVTINQLANIRSGNANLGNLATANYFSGTLTTSSQPNVTSLGTLTSLSVLGTTNLGNVSSVKMYGGSNNYVMRTDGTGNLSWVAASSISVGGSNTQVQYNDGNVLAGSSGFTFDNTTNSLTVTNLIAAGNSNLGNSVTSNYFIGDGSRLTNLPSTVGNITVTNSANLGNVGNVHIGGGTAGKTLVTDGLGNLSWSNFQACVLSTVTNIVAGSELQIQADYANASYPAGVFTVNQLGPVVFNTSDSWASGGTAKNAYANYIANTVNTQNVSMTLSLSNATFSVQSTDTITIGSSSITGANLTALNITGTGGTYTIPSSYLSNTTQTQNTDAVSVSLTTSRGVKTSTGTTLTNTQPVPFLVNSLTGNFPSSSVPYWNLNQIFNWSASVTGTATSGHVTYSGGASGSLTSSGATSGTSGSLDSTLSYTITSTDYTGAGLYGAGTRSNPSTVTGSITPATKYYPVFHKVTSSNSNPNFTTSDSSYTSNYALGQGANTTSTTTDYVWIATPGNTAHTFAFTFLASLVTIEPDQIYLNQTISGQTYNVYGFTNSSSPVFIYTLT